MPEVKSWRGDAQAVRQVTRVIPQNVAEGHEFTLRINRKELKYKAVALSLGSLSNLLHQTCQGIVNLISAAIEAGTPAEFAELTASLVFPEFAENVGSPEGGGFAAFAVDILGPEDGTPFTLEVDSASGAKAIAITTWQKGEAARNEFQRIELIGPPTGGTFTLSFAQQVTGNIAFNASAATVQTALEALNNIAPGDVTVTGNNGGPWTVEFKQAFAAVQVPQLLGNGSLLTGAGKIDIVRIDEANWTRGELQTILPSDDPAVGGFPQYFTLGFRGHTTDLISPNASADDVRRELEVLPSIGTGSLAVESVPGGGWRIRFQSGAFVWAYGVQDVPLLVLTGQNEFAPSGWVVSAVDPPIDAGVGIEFQDKFEVSFRNPPIETPAGGVTVTTIQEGTPAKNEIQRVVLAGPPTGGTFTLTFSGQTTGNIAFNANAATITTALEALSNIAPGDVTVTGTDARDFTVEFKQAYAGSDVPLMTGNGANLTGGAKVNIATTTQGKPGTNEVQTISALKTGAGEDFWQYRFKLQFGGDITDWMMADSSAVSIQAALQGLPSIGAGNVSVTVAVVGSTRTWTVTFTGGLANSNVNQIAAGATLLNQLGASFNNDGAVTTATTTEGSSTPVNEVQTVTLANAPTSGTFTLTFQGQTTANIAYNDSAGAMQTALEGLSNIGVGDVAVTRAGAGTLPSPYVYTVTFQGALAGQDVAQMTGTVVSLAGTGVAVSVSQEATAAINEQQSVSLAPTATGTFRLTWDPGGGPETTAPISVNATAAQVRTALEGLATPVPGDFTVTGPDGGAWIVTFIGTYAGTNVNAMTGAVVAAGAGTFTLSYGGQTTTAINFPPEPPQVAAALSALSVTHAVTVVLKKDEIGEDIRTVLVVTITPEQPPLQHSGSNLTASAAGLTGGHVAIETTQDAAAAVNTVLDVRIKGAPTGGTFTLTHAGNTTAGIAFNATAAAVTAALEALASIGVGDVIVTGSAGGPYRIEFALALGGTVQTLTGSAAGLTGSAATFTKQELVTATGPNWVNNPKNWSTGNAVGAGDTLIFENSAVPVLYGLDTLIAIDLAVIRRKSSHTGRIGLPRHTGLYEQYRPTKLIARASLIVNGEGDGPGAPFNLDTNTIQTDITVLNTSQPEESGVPAFLWKGAHANSTFRIVRGSAGLVFQAGETGQLSKIQVGYVDDIESDAEVALGSGLILGTIEKLGGDARIYTVSGGTAFTLISQAGLTVIEGEGPVAQVTIRGGEVKYNTTGALGGNTIVTGEGILDFSGDMRPKTVTNPVEKHSEESQIKDPFGVVNSGSAFVIDCNQASLSGIDVGRNRRVSISAVA
jgi:hypothetical protein